MNTNKGNLPHITSRGQNVSCGAWLTWAVEYGEGRHSTAAGLGRGHAAGAARTEGTLDEGLDSLTL